MAQKKIVSRGRSSHEIAADLKNLASVADRHAFETWGQAVARGEAVPVTDAEGKVTAYVFPYIIGKSKFPDPESLTEQLSDEQTSFGTIFAAAYPTRHPILRIVHQLHPMFVNTEAALAIARRELSGEPILKGIIWLGLHQEYYNITNQDQRLLLDVRSLEKMDPEEVLGHHPLVLGIEAEAVAVEPAHTAWVTELEAVAMAITPVYKLVPMAECVPIVNWTWWCVPTANSMVVGYYDNFVKGVGGSQGYGRLISYWFDHPTSGHNVPDYIDQLIDPNSGTWREGFKDFPDFIKKTFGYTFTDAEVKVDSSTDWAWEEIKKEIDAGRPFIWTVPGHSTCAVGYHIKKDGSKNVVINTTWGDTVKQQREEWLYTLGDGMRTIQPSGGLTGQDVALWKPDGGETLLTNIPYRLEWFVWGTRIKTAELSYSIDGGNNWTIYVHAAPCVPGWNVYEWTPTLVTDRARFRLRCHDNNEVYIAGDGSQNNFAVKPGPRLVTLKTILVKATTDGQGAFSAQHGLEHYMPDGYAIRAITVAVQHKNGNWHTIDFSNSVDNRFWWNNEIVAGVINSANFYKRPVQVVIFAESVVG